MTMFRNPFDANKRLKGCPCGAHASAEEHRLATAVEVPAKPLENEGAMRNIVETALMRAIFPNDGNRRAFLSAVGSTTASAVLASVFPVVAATEAFAQGAAPEKKNLKVGFIPITCATPIIMASPMGFYSKQGLDVEVVKTAGWAVIRDKTINKEYDAAHMLSPMPLAITGHDVVTLTLQLLEQNRVRRM